MLREGHEPNRTTSMLNLVAGRLKPVVVTYALPLSRFVLASSAAAML
jgi:hypothetical protein